MVGHRRLLLGSKPSDRGCWIAVGTILLIAPRTDPDGRSLAHSVLIADDWRQSEPQDKDGLLAVEEASAQPRRE